MCGSIFPTTSADVEVPDMCLTETSTRPRLSAASTLRINSARLQSPLPMAIQTLEFASRSVTLVRTCFPTDSVVLRANAFALQDARTRRTSLYTVNFSNQIILLHPPPHLRIPPPYYDSVPHASSPYPLCNKRDRPGPMTQILVSLPHSCTPESAAPKNRPLQDSSGGKRKRYSRTRATS